MARTFAALLEYLDRLRGRAPLRALAAELGELEVDCDELAEFLRFGDGNYQRNLIRAGEWYNVWLLCWKNGQRSPIHDHTGSSCGFRVLRGTATVTTCEFAPNGHVKATSSQDFGAGSVVATQDADMHQVSALQAEGDLVTLHVYSPPLARMNTYSLFDRRRGEDVWVEDRRFLTAFP